MNDFKRALFNACSLENAYDMDGYRNLLAEEDYEALLDGKVSFAEVDMELAQKKALWKRQFQQRQQQSDAVSLAQQEGKDNGNTSSNIWKIRQREKQKLKVLLGE